MSKPSSYLIIRRRRRIFAALEEQAAVTTKPDSTGDRGFSFTSPLYRKGDNPLQYREQFAIVQLKDIIKDLISKKRQDMASNKYHLGEL